ncbi:MAG: DNA repair protein RadC [Thermoanaerobaculia bacterium]|nr:DNA repair protein RadC [Thermoanaerobaculia bacterium]
MSEMAIADLPLEERPRERLLQLGPQSLTDTELVAVLLGSGTRGRNAISLARDLLQDGLTDLSRREWSGGPTIPGVGNAKGARLAAAFELGRRLASRTEPWSDPVRQPESLAKALIARYSHYVQERLGAVYLDSKNRVIRERVIYVGTLNATTVSNRDIFRFAILDHAASMVIFHNHPSGDPAPSAEDLVFTRAVVEAGKLMGVNVLDHLILGNNRYVSLRSRGLT